MNGGYVYIAIAYVDESLVLTLIPRSHAFQVAIIPYTFASTNICDIRGGSVVNIEFDIPGKYIARLQQL